MKNWLPLVLGPEFAMDSKPGLSWVSSKVSSSNLVPYIDSPPLCIPLHVSTRLYAAKGCEQQQIAVYILGNLRAILG